MANPSRKTKDAGSASETIQSQKASTLRKQQRQATVYDAVAGRVSSTGFITFSPRVSKYRDTLSSSTVPVPPEEVLFRRKGAPERYEEDDFYWADRFLTEGQTLPESDLLKAIHTYASDFYGRATEGKGLVDFESMDETALLGLGILLEEMAEHVLGKTGDLAFVEGEEVEEEVGADRGIDNVKGKEKELQEQPMTAPGPSSTTEEDDVEPRRTSKRRKIKHTKNDNE
ncbi:hypothetical protein N7G274_007104 [Stereocaulon virgatum]|uniref:Uncharacterized protein n=1 Tax=Stereocaulon virgatum TaxID=373712 RepID=A0ABR4A5J0_9LECA